MKVPPHPAPPNLIRSLTIRADCVEGNANLASIGTSLVALVFDKVISVAPPERHTDTFPVSQSTPAFLAGNGEDSISVSIEDFAPSDWAEKVYKPDIENGAGKLYKRPGYGPLASSKR